MKSRRISEKTWWGMLAAGAVLVAGFPLPVAQAAPSQTAQSVMVDFVYGRIADEIDGEITWTYARDAAETYYTHAWDGNAPVVTKGSGEQTSPGVPAPDANKLRQHAQDERCTFFSGGSLTADTYTQTVNGTKGWKWTYTFNITPTQASVARYTEWTSEETGGVVNVGFKGFVASESFLKNGTKNKYSFTLMDDGGQSRVSGVSATLKKLEDEKWVTLDEVNLNNVDTDGDTVNDSLAVTSTTADYVYSGNGGRFGKPEVYGALHAPEPGSKAANEVTSILTGDELSFADNFAGNDNDLVAGNVHQADYTGSFPVLTESGDYRTIVSGTIKGNGGTVIQSFSVSDNSVVIGGCTED